MSITPPVRKNQNKVFAINSKVDFYIKRYLKKIGIYLFLFFNFFFIIFFKGINKLHKSLRFKSDEKGSEVFALAPIFN